MFYISSITNKIYEGDWSYNYNETEGKTEFYINEAPVLEISGELNEQEAEEYFKENFETKTREYYFRSNRSLHELDNGLTYYNHEGYHFRVFRDFEDGMKWLEEDDDNLVVEEFDDEMSLDEWLEDALVVAKITSDKIELYQGEEQIFVIEQTMSQRWYATNTISGFTFEAYNTIETTIKDLEKRFNIIVVNLKEIENGI